jgi:uncharacterized membrane protein
MNKILPDLFRGRFLGHPIHAMLVHFPSAFFPTALLFDIASFFLNNSLYSMIAFYMLGLGVISGVVAACFGAIDYVRLPPEHKAWKKASIHAFLNVIWLIGFGTLFGINMMKYPQIEIVSITQLICIAFLVVGLLISNFLGGELVFHHGVGSISSNSNDKY